MGITKAHKLSSDRFEAIYGKLFNEWLKSQSKEVKKEVIKQEAIDIRNNEKREIA